MGFETKLRNVWLILSLLFLMSVGGLSNAYGQDTPPVFDLKWGSEGTGDGQFNYPAAVAVVNSGNVFVADTLNHRIQKFDSSGVYLGQWGTNGTGDGQFNLPLGVAVDSADNVYVSDTHNHRIQKFDSSGAFLAKWGSYGSGDGQFDQPSGVTVDSAGNVFVVDYNNHRIQKFDGNGTFLTKWGGSYGSGNGQFAHPCDVACDSAGNVFVADTYNHRIQKFDGSGTFLAKWGGFGSGDGQFDHPFGVAVDSAGSVYVADSWNHRIQKFDGSGTFLTKWGSEGTGNGQFNEQRGIAVDGTGNVFVSDTFNHRIQKFVTVFKSYPDFNLAWGTVGTGDGQFDEPAGTAVDGFCNVFVADTENHRIQKFDSSGNFLAQWGGYGTGEGQFNGPQDVAVDAHGNVFVADSGNDRIVKFDNSGVFLGSWGSSGSGEGQFNDPRGIAVDSDGSVFVADHHNHRIVKFDGDGIYLTQWGAHGSEDGQLQCPWGVAAGSAGAIYVADTGNGRIVKFDGDGLFLAAWAFGAGDVQFDRPKGVAVDSSGDVYVTDHYNHRIHKFDQNGAFLAYWGERGSGDGEFIRPLGIAVDSAFNTFVSDSTGRIQKFTYEDRDGDGVLDIHDAFPYDPGESSDNDGDGIGDNADDDDDNDGVADAGDPSPDDPDICGDTDADTCDDCAIGTDDFGPLADNDPLNDGPDGDGDGICDAGEPGTIIVEKQTNPDGAADTFTFAGHASGTIMDGEQIVVAGLAPGAYTSQETVPSGWALTAITCDDLDSSGDLSTKTAHFELQAGETVKCIFYNSPAPLAIHPELATVMVRETVEFTANNGAAPYSWEVKQNQTGAGLVDNGNGTATYTAGIEPGTDVVQVEDGNGDTADAVVKVTGPGGVVPQANWTLLHVDSDALDFEAEKAFDGDPLTMWHTPWGGDATDYPHEIWIDLGNLYTIHGFKYLPRQDGSENGRVSGWACYAAMDMPVDEDDWGPIVDTGVFANDGTEKEIAYDTPATGRYWRFKAIDEVNGNPWASAAEFSLTGTMP